MSSLTADDSYAYLCQKGTILIECLRLDFTSYTIDAFRFFDSIDDFESCSLFALFVMPDGDLAVSFNFVYTSTLENHYGFHRWDWGALQTAVFATLPLNPAAEDFPWSYVYTDDDN